MFDRKTSRLAALGALIVFLLALAVPAPTRSAAAGGGQPQPLTLSPVRGSGTSAPGTFPRIAASPLLDQLRQQGGAKGAQHLVDQQVLRTIQHDAQQARSAAHPRLVSSPHPGVQAVTGRPASTIVLPSPAAAPSEPAGRQVRPFVPGIHNAPAQSSANGCVNLIGDSQIDDPANANLWPAYAEKFYYEDPGLIYTSPPYAFLMIEKGAPEYAYDDDDNVVDDSRPNSPDVDAFGQVISVPQGTTSITVSFNFRYDPDSAVLGDLLYYEFYELNGSSLGDPIGGFPVDVGNYADGGWWTQTTRFDDPTFLSAVRGKQVALVLRTYNNVDSNYAVVRIDDIYAEACQPPATIKGTVTQAGASDLSDALILLGYFPPGGGDLQLLGLTFPNAAGIYQFDEVPELPAGGKYQIFFLNYSFTDAIDNTRVSFWAGPLVSSLAAGVTLTAPTFDIKDVLLGNPDSYTQQVMAGSQLVTFNWQSRGVNANQERYQFCIYDQQTVYPNTDDPVYLCTEVLQPHDLDVLIGRSSFPADYAFRYDHPYSWYITVYGAGSNLQTSQSGLSFYEHAVTFKQSVAPPPNSPPPPNPTPPPPQTGKAWTVMFYIAGDNNLGDPQRVPNMVSNLQGQWASLKALAVRYPNINLVTLTDFYGNTGTQFCYLKPVGAPQCQELGEKNTADPATLADFVKRSLQLYPAAHTMLVISDHGHSIAGVATDETTANTPSMAPDQIRQAFANAGLGGATKLDILFYNTCLMGSFEVAFDASAYARYMVASPDLVWVLNLYDRMLPKLVSTGADPARTTAKGIVEAYGQSVDAIIPGSYRTMAAYDLARAGAVNTALSTLGQTMNANLAGSRAGLAAIRTQVQVYDSSGNDLLDQVLDTSGTHVVAQEEDGIVDLRHLATLLKSSTNPALAQAIKNAANGVLTALGPVADTPGQSFVIASQLRTGEGDGGAPKNFGPGAGGLGIFFPNGQRFGGQLTLADAYLYQGLYAQLNAVTQWDDFLRSYLSGAIAQGRGGVVRGRGGVVRGGQPQPGGTVPPRLYLPIVRRP